MARTVNEIEQFIYAQMALRPSLAAILSNPSDTAVWKDFVHCIAVELAVNEQLQDAHQDEVEETINRAPISNIDWVKQKTFEFQYDAVVPQVLTLVDGVPQYPIVDPTKRIITLVCVRFSASRLLSVLVAKGSPPGKLDALELGSLTSYFMDGGSATTQAIGLGVAGVAYVPDSLDPDEVFIEGTIYVSGQYYSTIKPAIIAAIEAYLYDMGADGRLLLSKLNDVIQSVPGVNDLNLINVAIRSNATAFGSKTFLVQASETLSIAEDAAAGYAIGETTASNTLNDKITIAIG